jgi:hypothetical protein
MQRAVEMVGEKKLEKTNHLAPHRHELFSGEVESIREMS